MLAAGADFYRSLELVLPACSFVTIKRKSLFLYCPFPVPFLSSGGYRANFRGFKARIANLFSIFDLENTTNSFMPSEKQDIIRRLQEEILPLQGFRPPTPGARMDMGLG